MEGMEWEMTATAGPHGWLLQKDVNDKDSYTFCVNLRGLSLRQVGAVALKLGLKLPITHIDQDHKLAKSKGEACIAQALRDLHLEYEVQKTFPDLKNLRPLRFDFYVPELQLLVEHDGEQHFRPVEWMGGEDAYAKLVRRDLLKNGYCAAHAQLSLLRIGYWQQNEAKSRILDAVTAICTRQLRLLHDREAYLREEAVPH
jgi:hypothetical protein